MTDAKRQRKLYAEFLERKKKLALDLFDGKCFLCSALYQEGRPGFHLHHVEYHPTESEYPRNSKAMSTRWKRLKEAEMSPARFRLLCARCHQIVETIAFADRVYGLDTIMSLIP